MLHIVVEREGQPRKELRFAKDEVVVGREAEHDLQLAFEDGASRQHCRLFVDRGQTFVEDLGSRNGTKVNGKRIAGKTPITAADEVEVGKVKLRLGGSGGKAVVRPRAEPEPQPAPKARAKAEPAPQAAPKARAKPEPEPQPAPKARAKPEPEPQPAPKARAKPEPAPQAAPKVRTKEPDPEPDTSVRVNIKANEPASAPEPEGKPTGPVNDENESCRAAIDPVARRWRELGRPAGLLLHGPLLARGIAWLAGDKKLRPRPSELHREFIQASRGHRRHLVRDLSIGAGAFAFALVGGSVTARALHRDLELKSGGPGTDSGPGQCTPDNPDVKRANELALKAGEQTDVELAILAGARAVAAADGPCARQSDAERVLRDALSRQRSRVIGRSPSPIRHADVGRDDRDVVTVDSAGAVTLWDRTGGSGERPLPGGSGAGQVAALGPEGRWLAVGTASGALDLWDLQQRAKPDLAKQLEGHRDPITAIGFSEDGRLLASGDRRGTIRIWDMRGNSAGNYLGELRKHTGAIESLVFRDGGTRLYSFGGKQAYAYDLQDGKRKGKELLLAIGGDTTAMAVNGEGDEVVVGDSIGQVLRWKVKSLARATSDALASHTGAVVDLAFLPKERAVLSLGTDKQLIVTELEQMMREGAEPLRVGLRGLQAEPLALAADPTGRRIAVSAKDHKIYVWDVRARHTSAQPVVTFDEHIDTIESVLSSFDGNSLLSASADGTVRLWPLQSAEDGGALAVLADHQGPVTGIGLSTDAGRLLSVGQDKAVRAWRIDDRGTPRRMFERTYETPVGTIELSPDGRWAAVGVDRQILMYDLTSGDRELRPVERSNHNEAVSRIAFNLGGDRLVTADYGGTINTWAMRQDGPEESPTRSISLGSNVTALALAPTTPYLAAAGADNRVTLWAMNGTTAEHLVAQHDKTVLSLTFSNGGEYLVSTSDDARALLRKVDKGRTESPTERSAIPHDQRVRAAAFSPDKRWLATGSDDGAIVLTDLERGTERKVLRGHEAAIVGLSFESGSEVLVSASLDKTARLWLVSEVDRGGETRPIALSGHSGPIGALRLDGAGRLVVTAGADGSIRVWPLKHELLIRLACRAVGRDFRDDEWATLYPSEPIEPLCAR